jgi:hypothetical protein
LGGEGARGRGKRDHNSYRDFPKAESQSKSKKRKKEEAGHPGHTEQRCFEMLSIVFVVLFNAAIVSRAFLRV